jgi:hypothetical protein
MTAITMDALDRLILATDRCVVQTGREFLASADGLDRGAIIRRVAERFVQVFPNATLDEAEQAIWKDAQRLFGWHDLAGLEPGGHA